MVEAAADLFLDKGFAATSLNDVVRKSGGSLATLYALFNNKQGLLRAIMEERCAAITTLIAEALPADQPPDAALRLLAERLLDLLSDSKGIALLRIVVAESPHCPEIGRVFYDAGPGTAQNCVAGYLTAQAERGALVVPDPPAAAAMFFQMVLGNYHMRLLCNLPSEIAPADKQRHLDFVVAAFVKIHQTPDPAASARRPVARI